MEGKSELKYQKKLHFLRLTNDQEVYARFRTGTWYETSAFTITDRPEIQITDYREHHDFWSILEKRANPLAVMLAAIVSSFVTLIGTNIASLLQERAADEELRRLTEGTKSLGERVNILEKRLSGINNAPDPN